MCQSFGSMGAAAAEREIEQAEQSPSSSSIHSEIKPFTTKVDSHVIEALDLVASSMGISRNTLVVKLINHYLPQAFESFHSSRFIVLDHSCTMSEKSSDQFVISSLESLLASSEVSKEAKAYLERSVVSYVVAED